MHIDQASAPHVAFLVERYLPASAAAGLATSVSDVTALCMNRTGADAHGGDATVRYLLSMYLPSEDTCFCLFDAASPDAVRAINVEGAFPLDRITRAVLLRPPTSS